MYCSNCGAPNEEYSIFCESCGKAIDSQQTPPSQYAQNENVAQDPVGFETPQEYPGQGAAVYQTPQIREQNLGQASGQPPKKPNSKIAVIIIAALVVVLGAGAFGASQIFARDFAELTRGPEKYAKDYISGAIDKSIDYTIDFVEHTFATIEDQSQADCLIKADISDEYLDNFASGVSDETLLDMIHMLGKSSIHASGDSQLKDDKIKVVMNETWSVKDKQIVGVNLIIDDAIYLESPELYPGTTFALSFEDLGLGEDLSYSEMLKLGYPSLPDFSLKDISALAKYAPELKTMLKDMARVSVDQLEFNIDKAATINIDGQVYDVHAAVTEISVEQADAALIATLELIQSSDEYLTLLCDIVRDVSAISGGEEISKEELKDMVTEAIEDVTAYGSGSDPMTLKIFINAQNKVVGFAAAATDYEAVLGYISGKGYDLRLKGYYSENRIFGDLKISNGVKDFSINLDNGDTTLKLGDVSGLKMAKYQGMDVPVGAFDFKVSDWLAVAEGFDLENDYIKLANELTGSMKLSVEGEDYKFAMDVGNGSDASVSMVATGRVLKDPIVVPDMSNATFVDANDPYTSFDKDTLLLGIQNIVNNLKDAGYDFQELYDQFSLLSDYILTPQDYNYDDYELYDSELEDYEWDENYDWDEDYDWDENYDWDAGLDVE